MTQDKGEISTLASLERGSLFVWFISLSMMSSAGSHRYVECKNVEYIEAENRMVVPRGGEVGTPGRHSPKGTKLQTGRMN